MKNDKKEPDLTSIPETGLLDMVRLIIGRPGPLTKQDRAELEAINREFERRDKEAGLAKRRERRKLLATVGLLRQALGGNYAKNKVSRV